MSRLFSCWIVAVMLVCLPGWVQAADAGRVHAVVITDSALEPATVTLQRGEKVVWRNAAKATVQIRFVDALGVVCSPLVHFTADPDGTYRSDPLTPGMEARMCLIYDGTFRYEVSCEPGERVLAGAVTVMP